MTNRERIERLRFRAEQMSGARRDSQDIQDLIALLSLLDEWEKALLHCSEVSGIANHALELLDKEGR